MSTLDYTFVSEPMPYGTYKGRSPGAKEERQAKESRKGRRKHLPRSVAERLIKCRVSEPATDHPECMVFLYRRVCPLEHCEYMSGRYVSHQSALRALLGHLRWVHDYA